MERELEQSSAQQRSDQSGGANKKAKNEIWEWIKAIAIALVLVFLIRWLLFKPFIVDGPSMQPNFHTGERVIVNELLYNIRQPQRGEVIVFHVPEEDRDFIKRVIAVPGDTVTVDGDVVKVNGQQISEPYIQAAVQQAHAKGTNYNSLMNFPNDMNKETKVPAGKIFVMGDNRSDSTDSRKLGFINLKEVIGRADVIFWPVNDMKWINHTE